MNASSSIAPLEGTKYENDMTEKEPLRVLIVGAGIGGLTAGLALRQQGHEVMILESSKFSNETGAAIIVAPNCNGLLRRMGLFIESVGANEMTGFNLYDPEGRRLAKLDLKQSNLMWQHPSLLVHRAKLHSALRERTVQVDGLGQPCKLHLGSAVVSVDTSNAEVQLANGETYHGDVLLGADGVHSLCRKYVEHGDKAKPYDSGHSAFRFLLPVKDLKHHPVTSVLTGEPGELSMSVSSDRRLVYYPCNDNALMNFLLIHPSTESQPTGNEWNQIGDKNRMLEIGDVFADSFKAMLKKAPEDTLKVWTLLDMDVLPTWVNSKMALLGDAAHPFLPHQGQGGAQAIEDAMSIAALLPLGTLKSEVPERLQLYQTCRQERANKVQQFTRHSGLSIQEQESRGIKYNPAEFNRFNFSHDEWHHSKYMLKRHLWSKSSFRWRQPLSFGPSPGPCQPLNLSNDCLSSAQQCQTQYSIRFKTSTTYLKNLFPTSQFSFAAPGTFAQASLVCTNLRNVVWLSDMSYTSCGLYIHGVKYTKKDGDAIQGTFLPVTFMNSSEAAIAGREEQGAPISTCDIEITSPLPSSRKVTLSWRGTIFGELELNGIGQTNSGESSGGGAIVPKPTSDHGILTYRYIPAVGQPGVADAEYTIFEPFSATEPDNLSNITDSCFTKNQELKTAFLADPDSQNATQGRIKFWARGWQQLPTINHIVQELAEMPIYDIIEAKIEFLPFIRDAVAAHRVEKP